MFASHPQVDEERAGVRARGAVEAPLHIPHFFSVLMIPPTNILGHLCIGDGAGREVPGRSRKPLDAVTLLLVIHLR